MINTEIHISWQALLLKEFQQNYFIALKKFLTEEKRKNVIFPPEELVFSAFNFTPYDKIKVVIIGQDPYHGSGQANGFCFSVNNGVKCPPSLINIFKEVKNDFGCELPSSGNLIEWAKQGVFLLNSTLTVRKDEPGSHQNKGWEQFTDAVIKLISEKQERVVFMLWGNFAKAKVSLIDSDKHLVLMAAHPSPLARGAFFGCKHFSQANRYLALNGKKEIDWCL